MQRSNLQKMVDENLPFLWVMEDDAHFCPDFVAEFRRYYELTHKDWEYVAVGSANILPIPESSRIAQIPMAGMHCYLISLEGAKKVLALVQKVGFWYVDMLVYFMMLPEPGLVATDRYVKRFLSFLRANGHADSVLAEAPSRWKLRFSTYLRPETTREELLAAGSRVGKIKSYGLAFQSDATPSETELTTLYDFLMSSRAKKAQDEYAIRHIREYETGRESSSKRSKRAT